ncbi:MAG: hypothetical protein HY905_02940 [Deltaproteobacteria bacterium]|nr:hypothetical protein [Deltaproteobacteria bacterium]
MKKYPLIFTFRDLIHGNGFVAGITMEGRVLLSEEPDGSFWMFGVQPGGLADGGRDRDAAFRAFKNGYLSVLYDIAAEAPGFDLFRAEVEELFCQVNEPNRSAWDLALADVRRTNASLPNLERRFDAESRAPELQVVLVDTSKATPASNKFDEFSEAA